MIEKIIIEYEITSENISDRCKGILSLLETKLVTKSINQIINNLDNLGNSLDNSVKYDDEQKEFIKKQILILPIKKAQEKIYAFKHIN